LGFLSAEILLRELEDSLDNLQAEIEWSRFPLKVMRKLIKRAGGTDTTDAALYRKNDHARKCQDGPLCAPCVVLAGCGDSK